MPYLIQGSVEQIFTSFRLGQLVGPGGSLDQIDRDIPRTYFFGTAAQHDDFLAIWSNKEQSSSNYYAQGNMDAGNLDLFFGIKPGDKIPAPFYTKEELEEEEPRIKIEPHMARCRIAYLDKSGQARSLLICYRRDDPSKWIIAHSENPNKLPGEAKVKILASFDPSPFCGAGQRTCEISTVPSNENALIDTINSPILTRFIGNILKANNRIDPAAEVINQFTSNLSPTNQFAANDNAIAFLYEHVDEVLANSVLKMVQRFGLKLTDRQLHACLIHEGDLYQRISQYVVQGNEKKDKRRLDLIIFLDKWNLNNKQDLVANDKELAELLYGLKSCVDNLFLADCLRFDQRLKGLRFLMKITAHDLHWTFARQLSEVNDPLVWNTLGALADLQWVMPDHSYRYRFVCKYLLNSPATSLATLGSLLDNLTPTLQEVFDPIKLADHLSKSNLRDGGVDYLQQADRRLSAILPSYKEGIKPSLSPDLFAELAEKYMHNPDHNLLSYLTFCSNAEQIRAAYSLAEARCFNEWATIESMVLDPVMVSIINDLSTYKLNLQVLGEGKNMVALKEIYKIENPQERRASLILFAQKQLGNAYDYFHFRDSCKTYPELAGQVISLHKKGFGAPVLRTLAFEPNVHQAVKFLSTLAIPFGYNDLNPVFCQSCMAIADMTKAYQGNQAIVAYLKAILPRVMAYYSGQTVDHRLFAEATDLAKEELAKKRDLESKKLLALINNSAEFLSGQLNLFRWTMQLGIDESRLIIKNRVHAHNAATAVGIVAERAELGDRLFNDDDSKKAITEQILAGFTKLEVKAGLNKATIKSAVEVLFGLYAKNRVDVAQMPFDKLLSNRLLRSVIPVLTRHDMPILPFLDGKPLSEKILVAINNLNLIAPDNTGALKLAMERTPKGHDFRLLLTRIPPVKQPQPELVEMLIRGVGVGRIHPLSEPTLDKNFKNQATRELAVQLDESLLVVNNLRKLGLDSKVIEFTAQNNEKSKYFCNAILRVEAETSVMLDRLQRKNPNKYGKLISGPVVPPVDRYRKDLYLAMYKALSAAKSATKDQLEAELKKGITKAEKHIEAIMSVDHHPIWRTFKMWVSNLVLGALTLLTAGIAGYGFYHHYQKTGDLFFYSRPTSAESYRASDKQTLEEIEELISTAPVA